ncbi:phosphate ABC transporter substrate-binding protein [Janthinobacterium sp. PC23-8]|uniref:phosphate ABC transporter substrate-binding protein n=1 Tax=Janthinobacterium sp. PC23-8 TaxID=2012679 RepID=UPI0026D51252
MYMVKKIHTAIIAAGLALLAQSASAEVVVIVSAKNAATALTEEQASDIFLGKNSALPGSGPATPVDQADGSPLRDQFYTKVSSKTAAQMKAYWAKQIFTGKGQAPKEAGDSAAVKAAVAGNPNLIGYIDRSAVDATVKVLLTVK